MDDTAVIKSVSYGKYNSKCTNKRIYIINDVISVTDSAKCLICIEIHEHCFEHNRSNS